MLLLSEMSPGPMQQALQYSPTSSAKVAQRTFFERGQTSGLDKVTNESPAIAEAEVAPDINPPSADTPEGASSISKILVAREQYANALKKIRARSVIVPYNLPQFPSCTSDEEFIAFKFFNSQQRYDTCYKGQKKYLNELMTLRLNRPTGTFRDETTFHSSIAGDPSSTAPIPPPLELVSATILPLEAHMLLERTKAHGVTPKKTGSMATFFNPYSKKADSIDDKPTLVAEGEERTILIKFNNRLGISLDIPSCELEFSTALNQSIQAPPLSFKIPAKSSGFVVCFPFKVLRIDHLEDNSIDNKKPLELLGLRITIFDRCFFLAQSEVEKNIREERTLIPPSLSIYERASHDKLTRKIQYPIKIDSVPPQPKLLVYLQNAFTPLEDSAIIPVHVCDGEICTLSPFRLVNDSGTSGAGKLLQLQILSVGLPGIPDEIIYDSHASIKVEDDLSETSSDDFEELMDEDGLPPLRMRAFGDNISVENLNDKSSKGCSLTVQMAAAHDLGKQLEYKRHNIRLRFRYRGMSDDKATLIWRRREVKLHVVRIKGPRISSMTFRPDLSWGSAVYELSKSLAHQTEKSKQLTKSKIAEDPLEMSTNFSGDDIVLLITVANECKSPIILSNKSGRIGGFDGSPMSTLRVTSGVSVKIPVVIQRIPRKDENGEDTDVAQEIINRTALLWVSEEGEGVNAKGSIRTGRVRIPQRCLKQLISDYPSFLSKVCKVPVSVSVTVTGHDVNDVIILNPGKCIEVSMCFKFQGECI